MMPSKHFELTEDDFERFRKLINQTSGIFFDRGKRDLLRLGLSDRADAVGAESLAEYYEQLTSLPDREVELRRLLDHHCLLPECHHLFHPRNSQIRDRALF